MSKESRLDKLRIFKSKNYEPTLLLVEEIIGVGCEVLENGTLEHWTSYPHGSGTTTDLGEATDLQKAASLFLKELRKVHEDARKYAREDEVERFARCLSKSEAERVLNYLTATKA